jgi:hypothetical protein
VAGALTFWKTYAAVAVLGGLGAYIYFVEAKKPDDPEKAKKEKVFTLADKSKVKEVTLAPSGSEPIRLAKDGTGWKMTEPQAVPADSTETDSLLSTLESVEIDEVVNEAPPDLQEYGLASPKLTVAVLVDGASEPVKLLVGDKTPDGNGVYAKLPSAARVFTIPSYVESSLEKKPFDLRDRDLLHVKRDAVKTLEVTGPEGSYALARDAKGDWAFTRPVQTQAGRWAVDGLLGTIENLRMESVAAESAPDLKKFGLVTPARTVTLGLGDATRTLQIGASSAEKKYYAREASSQQVAVIPGAIVDDLAKGMNDLRGKRLLEVATYEVDGFEAEASGVKKAYAKSTEKDKSGVDTPKWKRTAPDAKELQTSSVEDALFKLGGVEVQEFIDAPKEPAAYGLDAPAFKLTVKSTQKGETGVEIGRKDGVAYARRSGDAAILKLESAKADEILKAFSEL